MTTKRISSYREFWPYYLGEHRKPATRWIHFAGTNLAMTMLVSAAVLERPMMILGAVVAAYGFAWFSHFVIEKNRPATFTYPLWSLISDFKMCGLMWIGKLDAPSAMPDRLHS